MNCRFEMGISYYSLKWELFKSLLQTASLISYKIITHRMDTIQYSIKEFIIVLYVNFKDNTKANILAILYILNFGTHF